MIEVKYKKDIQRLRRVPLAAQGLLQSRFFGSGISGARNAINHLGYVQLDTISVIERAHHHVFRSRIPNYKPTMINKLLVNKDIFEYWAHAAALLPMADFRFSLPYKAAIKSGQTHWYKDPDRKLMSELLARIRFDGPIRSRDVESSSTRNTGWWDWKPAKKALEQLYMEGELMVSERQGFEKTYDLTERVLPPDIDIHMPSVDEFAQYLLAQQLRNFGLVSLKGLTYQRRNKALRTALTSLLNEKLSLGELQQIKFANGAVFIVTSDIFDAPLPRVQDRMLILSPFDNSVIQRDRLEALFQFDYKLECYLPSAKRKYGYFSLPLLFRDHFIGRLDCKAHRKLKRLEIKSLHWEPHRFDQERVNKALVEALSNFCDFQQCESVSLSTACANQLPSPLVAKIDCQRYPE